LKEIGLGGNIAKKGQSIKKKKTELVGVSNRALEEDEIKKTNRSKKKASTQKTAED